LWPVIWQERNENRSLNSRQRSDTLRYRLTERHAKLEDFMVSSLRKQITNEHEAEIIANEFVDNLRTRLQQLIFESAISQKQVARETTIPQPVLSRFLNGGSLKLETGAILLHYLHVQDEE